MEQISARQASVSPPSASNYNLVELLTVCLADLIDWAVHTKVALLNPNRTLADALNLLHGMRHEQNRHVTALDKMLNTGLALLLEEHVADGQGLVNDQDIRLGNGGDCKSNFFRLSSWSKR